MLANISTLLFFLALIVVFAWLTRRAWGSRRALLKWLGVGLAGLLTVLSAATLVLALVGFYKLSGRHNNPVPTVQVARTSTQVARGQQLAHICANCHTSDGQLPLSGVNFTAKFGLPPIGTFYAPNLTPGGNMDAWSDGEVIRAIREGVHKDGRALLIMPAEDFRHLSDTDAQALVAYLRSQPPTGGPTPTNQFNVLGALFINLVDWRQAQPPVGQVSAPPPGTPAYGKYMVNILGCQDCHGPQLQGKVDTGQPGPPPGPNLTQIVPQWTEDQFMTFFNTGQLPGGGTVPILTLPSGATEPRMPWPVVRASATDDELRAMYAYLHSLQPAATASR